jgi:hypothetical protein
VTQIQRASWLAVLLVTLVAFGLIVPRLPALGDASMALDADTEVGMATASVTIPAGWDLDIAASSQQQPTASRDGVDVTTTDAVWLGESSDLLGNVAQLLFDGEAVIPDSAAQSDGPADGDSADGDSADGDSADGDSAREVWQLTPTGTADHDAPVRVDVIRDGQGVVLVVARGTPESVAAQSDAIDAISDSVRLDLSALDVQANA